MTYSGAYIKNDLDTVLLLFSKYIDVHINVINYLYVFNLNIPWTDKLSNTHPTAVEYNKVQNGFRF